MLPVRAFFAYLVLCFNEEELIYQNDLPLAMVWSSDDVANAKHDSIARSTLNNLDSLTFQRTVLKYYFICKHLANMQK